MDLIMRKILYLIALASIFSVDRSAVHGADFWGTNGNMDRRHISKNITYSSRVRVCGRKYVKKRFLLHEDAFGKRVLKKK